MITQEPRHVHHCWSIQHYGFLEKSRPGGKRYESHWRYPQCHQWLPGLYNEYPGRVHIKAFTRILWWFRCVAQIFRIYYEPGIIFLVRSAHQALLNRLPRVKGAKYTLGEHRKCLKGTRVKVLIDDENWVYDCRTRMAYWLDRPAGTGREGGRALLPGALPSRCLQQDFLVQASYAHGIVVVIDAREWWTFQVGPGNWEHLAELTKRRSNIDPTIPEDLRIIISKAAGLFICAVSVM